MRQNLTVLAVLLGCFVFSSCEKKETFTVTGRLESYIEDYVPSPTLTTIPNRKVLKKPAVRGELFQFHGKIGKPQIAIVEFDDEVNQWIIVLEPGNIVLDQFSKCAKGTPLNEAMLDCNNRINKIVISQGEAMMVNVKEEMLAIIDEHINDIIGTYYLSQCYTLIDEETTDAILAKAGPGFKDNKMFKFVTALIEDYRENPPLTDENARTKVE